MTKETNFYWSEIVGFRYAFSKRLVMVKQLQKIKKQDIIDFAENLVTKVPQIAVRGLFFFFFLIILLCV